VTAAAPARARALPGLPRGAALEVALRAWFRRQRKVALAWLSDRPTKDEGVIPGGLPDFDAADLGPYDLAEAITPKIEAIWDRSGATATDQLNSVRVEAGLDPNEWQVTDPNLRRAVDSAALSLAQETQDTTSREITRALAETRQSLAEGLLAGEAGPLLRKRILAIFDQAETWRAERIARTEAIRAHHAAGAMSAKNSGVVAGSRWVASSDACPICLSLNGRLVKVDDSFATIGKHPIYSDVKFPPAHVHCGCSVIQVLLPQYGGPAEPQWSQRLDQPTGAPEPKPLPGPPVWKPSPAKGFRRFDKDKPLPMEAWGKANYGQWAESLSVAEFNALNRYAGPGYVEMNDHLRGIRPAPTGSPIPKMVEDGKRALNRAELPEPIAVYRRVHLDRAGIPDPANLKTGNILDILDAFGSTSLKEERRMGVDTLEIRLPRGTKGAYLNAGNDIPARGRPLAGSPWEREFLLPPDPGILRVVEVKRDQVNLSYRVVAELQPYE
jgi:SPP1 gp7 family putative phage head morphogenesis protein